MHKKTTSIIATLGPSSDNEETLKEMFLNGVSSFRINFSHSSHSEILRRFKMAKKILGKRKDKISVFGDIQGPKIRLGFFRNKVKLLDNSIVFFSTKENNILNKVFLIDYPDFCKYIKKYDRIFIDDGRLEFIVEKITKNKLVCRVIRGGIISSRKGVSVVNRSFPLPTITSKDIEDIKFAVSCSMKEFALSFVRKKDDVIRLRKFLSSISNDKFFIISKIEDKEGFENISEIIDVSDAIMIARGDLGVSVERSIVPILQKEIIDLCNKADVFDIVATQMLDTMVLNPYPTRAEVNDIAVSVMQGADYLLLSAETAVGKYPLLAVKEMNNIIKKVFKYIKTKRILF
ncbi:MAG: pyruvate kinase [Elusimicrobiales bacterium]|nr:pyruvate kinase [Elusimicrobiales bacterium]